MVITNTKKLQIASMIFAWSIFFVPFFLNAESTFIVCDGPDCSFGSLIKLIQNIITYLIYLSVPLAALSFSYAGFLLITSGGDEGAKKKAKEIFSKTATGFVIVLSAWLIVYFILNALVDPNIVNTNLLKPS